MVQLVSLDMVSIEAGINILLPYGEYTIHMKKIYFISGNSSKYFHKHFTQNIKNWIISEQI